MRHFWWPIWSVKEKKYTLEEVKELCERIKEFNAGCIDELLSKHVDKKLEEWK
ncbi:MAG: hypothetical protein ACW976_06930 [Candidatus Ranarchaeia archaeon]|jgi:hypothetical protein